MNKKVFLSIAASMLLVGTQANAFGMGGMSGNNSTTTSGTTGNMAGASNGMGGSVQYGMNANGGYICIDGFSPMGGGSMAMSYGSASGCGADDFDFYYKTFGGFIENTGNVSSVNFKAGQDDTYSDGFWWREGKFSSNVYYGDPENDGKRYADDPNGAYPAWTWGRPEADPFVSANGAGDNLGGAAGIGLGGFGMGDGNKLKAGDTDTFYPLNFIEVNNYVNSFMGSYASDVSWNVAIYDKDHNEVFKKNYTTTMYYWETKNFQYPKYGMICPRSSVDKGEVVNDLAYNSAIHDNIWNRWPKTGLDIDFVSDGSSDATACADAVKLKDTSMTDTFTVKNSMMKDMPMIGSMTEKKYQLSFDGPYIYDDSKAGCPAVNEQGLPDTLEKWPAECFEKVDTIWADEAGKTRAFMRMTVTEVEDDNCGIKMPEMPCDIKLPQPKSLIDSMMQKAGTTLDKAKKAVEDAQDCDFSGLGS